MVYTYTIGQIKHNTLTKIYPFMHSISIFCSCSCLVRDKATVYLQSPATNQSIIHHTTENDSNNTCLNIWSHHSCIETITISYIGIWFSQHFNQFSFSFLVFCFSFCFDSTTNRHAFICVFYVAQDSKQF